MTRINTTLTEAELQTIIDHVRTDLHYGEGGSFVDTDNNMTGTDDKAVALAESACRKLEHRLMAIKHRRAARSINRAFASGRINIEIKDDEK